MRFLRANSAEAHGNINAHSKADGNVTNYTYDDDNRRQNHLDV